MKIKLKNITYIKDLGNIKTADNRRVRSNLIYRSSNLSKINQKEVDLLYKNNIRYVCDFRTDEEQGLKPELINVENIDYHHLPVVENIDNPAITKDNRLAILKDIIKNKGGVKPYMRNFYVTLVDSEKAINCYKEFFDILLNCKENEAVLFHCTQGKDRTGIGLMLLLSALGVKKETIIKKYMSYNKITWAFRFLVYIGVFLTKGVRFANGLNDVLRAVKSYILASYKVIETKYQGMDNYLRNIIGLTDEKINILKAKYVI